MVVAADYQCDYGSFPKCLTLTCRQKEEKEKEKEEEKLRKRREHDEQRMTNKVLPVIIVTWDKEQQMNHPPNSEFRIDSPEHLLVGLTDFFFSAREYLMRKPGRPRRIIQRTKSAQERGARLNPKKSAKDPNPKTLHQKLKARMVGMYPYLKVDSLH